MKTFEEYQLAAKRTSMDVPIDTKYIGMLHSTIGLTGEAGELANYVKKVVFHGHPYNTEVLKLELGDVLWYLSDIATRAGLTLDEIAEKNNEKLLRRYPNGFSQEDSRNRVE